MKDDNARRLRADRIFLAEERCDLDAFRALVERTVDPADYPFASDVISNVLIYDGDAVRSAAASPDTRKEMMAEWVEAMTGGPGIIVFRKAFGDLRTKQFGPRRPFRQTRRERPRVERAGEALPRRPRGVRRLLRQCCHRARQRGLARALLSDHLAAQRRQSGR